MTPPTTTEKGEGTRRRILEVAAQLFLDNGYAGTSMNDIIRASGLTKGGFYFHFTGKADLAVQALDLIRGEMRDEIIAAAGSHERAADQLAAMARAAVITKQSIRSRSGAALGRLCIELAAEPDAPRIEPFAEWFQILAALFRQAQAEGDMDPSVDPVEAGYFAMTSYIGMDHVADVSGQEELVAEHVEDYLEFIFRAVGMTVPVPAPAYAHPN